MEGGVVVVDVARDDVELVVLLLAVLALEDDDDDVPAVNGINCVTVVVEVEFFIMSKCIVEYQRKENGRAASRRN